MSAFSAMTDSFAADKPPPTWKKATSFIRVNADSLSSGPASPTRPLSPRTSTAGQAPAEPPAPVAQQAALGVVPPLTPIKAPPNPAGASSAAASPLPRTPAPAQPPSPAHAPPMAALTPRGNNSPAADPPALRPPPAGGHRRTTSWGSGSASSGAGKQHARSRSIEGLAPSGSGGLSAREAYRAQLERIGSLGASSDGLPEPNEALPASPALARRASLASPPGRAGEVLPNTQRRSSLGSPAKLGMPAPETAQLPPERPPAAQLGRPTAQQPVCLPQVRTEARKERELISWEEVDPRRDVYEAITTPDGRQALVRAAASGKAQEELLLLQEAPAARPPATPAQHAPRAPAAVYMLSDGRGGATPMAAFPVQCPDGRVVYHLYPTTPRAMSGPLSPTASPHSYAHLAAQHFPGSPSSVASGAGHRRQGSGSFSSPLLTTPSPGAFPASPTGYSPSPGAASHGSSPSAFSTTGFAPAGEAGANHQGPLSPAGSGRLFAAAPAPQAVHEHLAALALSPPAGPQEDPFGKSTSWAA